MICFSAQAVGYSLIWHRARQKSGVHPSGEEGPGDELSQAHESPHLQQAKHGKNHSKNVIFLFHSKQQHIEGVGRRQGFLWSLHFSAVARFELKGISVLASAWSHFQLLLGDGEQMFGSASLLYRRQLNTAECYVW